MIVLYEYALSIPENPSVLFLTVALTGARIVIRIRHTVCARYLGPPSLPSGQDATLLSIASD